MASATPLDLRSQDFAVAIRDAERRLRAAAVRLVPEWQSHSAT